MNNLKSVLNILDSLPTPTPPRQLRNKIAQLELDNRVGNTKVSKLLLLVDGLLLALNDGVDTIAVHEHNDVALQRLEHDYELLIDRTNEELINL